MFDVAISCDSIVLPESRTNVPLSVKISRTYCMKQGQSSLPQTCLKENRIYVLPAWPVKKSRTYQRDVHCDVVWEDIQHVMVCSLHV